MHETDLVWLTQLEQADRIAPDSATLARLARLADQAHDGHLQDRIEAVTDRLASHWLESMSGELGEWGPDDLDP